MFLKNCTNMRGIAPERMTKPSPNMTDSHQIYIFRPLRRPNAQIVPLPAESLDPEVHLRAQRPLELAYRYLHVRCDSVPKPGTLRPLPGIGAVRSPNL